MASLTIPGTTVSVLSSPSKMPCKSFSLPAIRSCPSATFGKGAICGESKTDTNCYANARAYTWPVVVNALNTRYQWAIEASMDPATGDEFVEIMSTAIQAEARRQYRQGATQAVFRLHDSGDLFNPQYARLWARIASNTPYVAYWIPTRQWKSKNLHMQAALLELSALPNVTLRPSALFFDDPAPVIEGYAAGSTASAEGYNCPAPSQGNACLDCRQCWSKDVVVSYHKH